MRHLDHVTPRLRSEVAKSRASLEKRNIGVTALAKNVAWEMFAQKDWQDREILPSRSVPNRFSRDIWVNLMRLWAFGYTFEPKTFEFVLMIPSYFKLCKQHSKLHQRQHEQDLDGEGSVHYLSNTNLCSLVHLPVHPCREKHFITPVVL